MSTMILLFIERGCKARPITSTFHHPMKRLMHMVGKAWYFMAKKMKGAHFIIDKTSDVPVFLEHVKSHFGDHEYVAKVLDIEGCFPNMPKDKIRQAMLEIVQDARNDGMTGVSVPVRSKKLKCSWKKLDGGFKWLSFEVMLMVLEFSLTQTICQLKDGRIIRQVAGIPMGDALSPGAYQRVRTLSQVGTDSKVDLAPASAFDRPS